MSASINMKKKNIAGDFLRRTAGLMTGAAGDYISEAMPVTTSTLKEAKSTIAEASSTLSNTMQAVMPTLRHLKVQNGMRNVFNWFMQQEESFDDSASFDDSLGFDIDVDNDAEIGIAQISESEKSANKISQSVIESTYHLAEEQMHLTANVITTLDKQSAVISTGFDRTNETLNRILEVVTKNTSTGIEATVAASNSENSDHNSNILGSGKFNFSEYKELVKQNIKSNPEFGMLAAFLPMFTNKDMLKTMITPENIVSTIFSGILNKKAPNLKSNMEAIDSAINDTIMTSLIRLGENNSWDDRGKIARIFGIDSSRKDFNNQERSSIEVKTVPYDSISQEALTNAIPGYLQKILVAVGGDDVVYDYRSRSFKTRQRVRKEFLDQSVTRGSIGRASSKVKNAFGTDQFGTMIYDMMLTDLGTKTAGGRSRNIIESFSDPSKFEDYIRNSIYAANGIQMTDAESNRIKQMAERVSAQSRNNIGIDISNQLALNNVNRNKRMGAYIRQADEYNVDLRGLSTSASDDIRHILETNGRISRSESSIAGIKDGESLEGVNYTNRALYEIYRILNRGINVFRVGKDDRRKTPYRPRTKDFLPEPRFHKAKNDSSETSDGNGQPAGAAIHGAGDIDKPNLLMNQELEDGTMEELTTGERVKRWGKDRGANLAHAVFSGSPEQVREAFGLIMRDVTQVTGDQVKKGAEKINQQFGNVTGYLKHKLFGAGYKYQDVDENGNPITVEVADNEKGGMFGFVKDYVKDMFKGTKDKASAWFKSVAGYFDYGESGDKEEKGVAAKRKRLLSASVGAFAGAGLIGGPVGLIMGAIAGNALSGLDIGSKIKNLLIGRNEKGKATGLITRAFDGIVDPIKFQIGKSVQHLGGIIKKNVVGPLSDIGLAIKDRISSAAETHFGKVFKFIGNIITSPFKAVAKIAKFPINLIGGAFRGAASIGGGVVGSGLNSIANSIAGKSQHTYVDENGEEKTVSTREYLRQRRKDRRSEFKNEQKYEIDPKTGEVLLDEDGNPVKNRYSNYKIFKKSENDRRAAWGARLKDYTSEHIMTPEEIEARDAAKRTAESTSEIQGDVRTLADLGSEKGSIFTHDEGIHERIDKIIELIRGRVKGVRGSSGEAAKDDSSTSTIGDGDRAIGGIADMFSGSEFKAPSVTGNFQAGSGDDGIQKSIEEGAHYQDKEGFGNSALTTAAVLAAEGDITTNDQRLVNQIFGEAAKDDSSKTVIHAKLRELLQSQQENSENSKEEKESFWEKLLNTLGENGILGNLLKWGGILAGIAALLNGLNLTGGGGIVENIVNNFSDAAKTFSEAGDSNDSVTSGVNTVLNLVDTKVHDKTALFNPFANVYHNRADGSGEDVVHQDATRAKNNWLLWTPLRQSITRPAWSNLQSVNYGIKSDRAFSDAVAYSHQASIAGMDGDAAAQESLLGKRDAAANKSGEYYEKSQEYAQRTQELEANRGRDVVHNIATTAARVGVMSGISSAAGSVASWGAQRLGMEEDQASRLGNYVTAGTTAGLMVNQASSMVTGKTSIVDKILEILKNFFNFLAGKFKAVKALQSFGGKIEQFFGNIYNKSIGKVTEKVAQKIEEALAARLGEDTAKQAVATLGVGIPIAIGAISGIASGLCGVEHLFQVTPGDADAAMKTVSAIETGVFQALEWTPAVGFVVAALDIIDSFIITGIFGKPLRQYIAEFLYNLIKGDGGATLSEKQGAFQEQRELYNTTYGTELNTQTFNDLVNNGSWIDKVWRGGAQKDENGNLKFDEAGGRIDGGLKGMIVGGERTYVKDEEGNVVRRADGSAVVARDASGNVIKANERWGDKVGQGFNAVKRFFAGGDNYETDENGVAKVDENGNYVVKDHTNNVFQRAGASISRGWSSAVDWGKNAISTVKEGVSNVGATIKDVASNLGDKVKVGLGSVKDGTLKLFDYIKSGDIKGLISSKPGNEDDENPVCGFGTALYGIGKVFAAIPTAVSAGGHAIVDSVTGVVNKVKDFGAKMSNERAYADKLLHDQSSSFTDLFKIEEDPDSPLSGFMKAAIVASRLSIIPTAFVKRVGGIIGEQIKKRVDAVKNNVGTLVGSVKNTGQYISSGDFQGLLSSQYQEDPENPANGFMHTIFSGVKFVSLIPTGISWVGHKVSDIFDSAVAAVKHHNDILGQNNETIQQLVKSGQVSELINLNMQDDPDSPASGFTRAIFQANKFLNVPVAGISAIGKKVSAAFNALTDKAKNVMGTLSQNHENLNAISKTGDFSALGSLTMEMDPENPVGGFTSAIFTIDKFVHYIPTGLNWIGSRAHAAFEAAKEKASNAFGTLQQNHESIKQYVQSGDVAGLTSLAMEMDPENPVGGLTNAIFTADKIIHVPGAALHYVGSKVKETFDKATETVNRAKQTLDQNVEKISDRAKAGDLAGLSSLTMQDDADNPLGGILNGIFTATKLVNYPRAAIHWVGGKIKTGFDTISQNITSNRQTLDTAVESLSSLAQSGDVKAIWSKTMTLKDGDPLAPIWNISFTISKLFQSAVGIFHSIGKTVSGAIDKVKSTFGGALEKFWDWLGGSSSTSTSTGGPTYQPSAPSRAPVEGVGGPTNEGGNPLNKDYKITSKFGPRSYPHSGTHYGIDMVPTDGSGTADIGSRYRGTVSYVQNNVPDTDRAVSDGHGNWTYKGSNSAGNQVWIDTDSGMRIKNMHIKAGTIPSTIKAGTRVDVGTKLGQMGSTGWSTGPHLHYQMESNTTGGNSAAFDPTNNVSSNGTISTFSGPSSSTITQPRTQEEKNRLAWLTNAAAVKMAMANELNSKGQVYSQQAGFTLTLDGKTYSMGHRDCSGYVGESLKFYDVAPSDQNFYTGNMTSSSTPMINTGFTSRNFSSWNDLVPGDVLVRHGDANAHTEIYVGKDSSGNFYVYSGGSPNDPDENKAWSGGKYNWVWAPTSPGPNAIDPSKVSGWKLPTEYINTAGLNSTGVTSGSGTSLISTLSSGTLDSSTFTEQGATQAATGPLGQLISTLTTVGNGFLQVITGGLISNTSSSSTSSDTTYDTSGSAAIRDTTNYASAGTVGEGAEELWKYFKSLGYSDNAVAGVLGCWTKESSNRPRRVEWDYSNTFKNMLGYDRVLNDRAAMDAFTQALFNQYARQGLSISRSAYGGGDGHLYPGLGYAQWTGPRGKNLLDFARNNKLDWGDSGTQLSFLDTELKGSYSRVRPLIEGATSPEQAASLFCKNFEGYSGDSTSRQQTARALWNQFHGKYGSGIGGPVIPGEDKGLMESLNGPAPDQGIMDILVDGKGTSSSISMPNMNRMLQSGHPTVPSAPGTGGPTIDMKLNEGPDDDDQNNIGGDISINGVDGHGAFGSGTTSEFRVPDVIPAGGPENEEPIITNGGSSIGDTSNYTPAVPPTIPNLPGTSQSSTVTPRTSTPQQPTVRASTPTASNITTVTQPIVSGTDLSGVVSMMGRVLEELSKISGNTGSSSNLLEELNQKDFVDQDLRASISALGNSRKRTFNRGSGASSSARSVANMAKP